MGGNDLPIRRDIVSDIAPVCLLDTVHQPVGYIYILCVLPEKVGAAILIEVHASHNLPVRGNAMGKIIPGSGVGSTIHIPDGGIACEAVLPNQVRASILVDVGIFSGCFGLHQSQGMAIACCDSD